MSVELLPPYQEKSLKDNGKRTEVFSPLKKFKTTTTKIFTKAIWNMKNNGNKNCFDS